MAYPDWYGPSIPTEWEDLPSTVLWTIATSGMYYGIYRWELLRTLSRMPSHAYVNPSRSALFRQAASRTSYSTVSRGVGFTASRAAAPVADVLFTAGARATNPAFIGPLLIGGTIYGSMVVAEQTVSNVSRGQPAWLGILPVPVASLLGFMDT